MLFDKMKAPAGKIDMRPGPLRLSLENRTDRRILPALWIADDRLHHLLGKRKPFLTAKRLLTNQTFRDIYRTDILDIDQRLGITSLTFVFTDLKGSTALYERVGDLVAYDLVRQHFRVLQAVVAERAGAVVKTIGDAVMATFPTPDRALAAALDMRKEMDRINAERQNEDLLLKIGIHEGPCLAVVLNESQDYFGQTVNMAARVQDMASSRAILVTKSVLENPKVAEVLRNSGLRPTEHRAAPAGAFAARVGMQGGDDWRPEGNRQQAPSDPRYKDARAADQQGPRSRPCCHQVVRCHGHADRRADGELKVFLTCLRLEPRRRFAEKISPSLE
jgi:class 3 adenylate cyclase